MKKSTVYVAFINSDLTEGRGISIPLAVCQTKTTAVRLGKGKNVQGSNAVVKPIDLIEITEKGNAKWYAPVKECLNIVTPSKQDLALEKERIKREKITQRAKELGLTEDEIKILKGIS
jgi:hypothetical protein